MESFFKIEHTHTQATEEAPKEMANTASVNLERGWRSALYPIFMRQMLSGGSLDSLFLYLKLT